MSKREKRIAAQQEKARLAEEKKAITVAKIIGDAKKPVSIEVAAPSKTPVTTEGAGNFNKLVEFSSSNEDRKGQWSWGVDRNWHPNPGDEHVEAFVASYHQVKTWRDVMEEKSYGKNGVKKKHVSYPVSSITKEARDRLKAIEMDDYEEIFRFRMTNLERLYGFVVGATFITVWFDPTHKVYPV